MEFYMLFGHGRDDDREEERRERRASYRHLQNERRRLRDDWEPMSWPDDLFRRTFRLNKQQCSTLIAELAEVRGPQMETSRCIPLNKKIFVALSFYASGSYQRITGSASHMAQQTTSKCIGEVTSMLNHQQMLTKWIRFPTTRACRDEVKKGFFDKYAFPDIIGALDGTHIAIAGPSEHEPNYFNRLHYHSLNVMIVSDSNLKILAVNAKFGGATHDSHVWRMSALRPYVEELSRSGESAWLLGDSGYPQRAWLMTPVIGATEGTREYAYNKKQAQARNTVERCFGVLKQSWRCLLKHRVLHYKPVVCSQIVNACCILHNMRSPGYAETTVDTQNPLLQVPHDDDEAADLAQGRAVRNILINQLR